MPSTPDGGRGGGLPGMDPELRVRSSPRFGRDYPDRITTSPGVRRVTNRRIGRRHPRHELRSHRGFPAWRRRRDSNPRYPSGYSGFQDRRIQPLCHSSVAKVYAESDRSSGVEAATERGPRDHLSSGLAINSSIASLSRRRFTGFVRCAAKPAARLWRTSSSIAKPESASPFNP